MGPQKPPLAILANVLAEWGHRIVFVVDESFEGELVKRGFEERMMRMAAPEERQTRGPSSSGSPRRVPQATIEHVPR